MKSTLNLTLALAIFCSVQSNASSSVCGELFATEATVSERSQLPLFDSTGYLVLRTSEELGKVSYQQSISSLLGEVSEAQTRHWRYEIELEKSGAIVSVHSGKRAQTYVRWLVQPELANRPIMQAALKFHRSLRKTYSKMIRPSKPEITDAVIGKIAEDHKKMTEELLQLINAVEKEGLLEDREIHFRLASLLSLVRETIGAGHKMKGLSSLNLYPTVSERAQIEMDTFIARRIYNAKANEIGLDALLNEVAAKLRTFRS